MADPAAHPGATDENFRVESRGSPDTFVGLSRREHVVDGAAATQIARGEHEMRRDLAKGILRVFIVGNAALWVLVVALVVIDVVTIEDGLAKPGDRIISQSVVKTLIAGTAVQVGIIMAVIARSLFRS